MEELNQKVNPIEAQPCKSGEAEAEDIIWAGLGKVAYSKNDICLVKYLLCA